MHRFFPQFRVELTLLAVVVVLLSSCAAWAPDPSRYKHGYTEQGRASWYGPGFHGKRAANGEIYDQEGLTAAHRYMPFGTQVQVTRRDTGAQVQVRITDRGPFVRGRIIDLSKGAAKILGAIDDGVVPVYLKIVATPAMMAQSRGTAYTIQLGKFDDQARAQALMAKLAPRIPGMRLKVGRNGSIRLLTQAYFDYDHAKRIARHISRDLTPGAFVIKEPAR